MKVMMAGGGTGGHVFPALAVAQELRRRDSGAEVLFVGTDRGLEKRLVPEAGFPLRTLPVRGLKGKSMAEKFRNMEALPKSFWISRRLLNDFRPEVVFGTGGYAAGPTLLQAALSGRPTVLFEPNAEPGFTNRVLAPLVTRAAVTFEEAARRFGSKAVRTGIPVREDFLTLQRREPSPPYTILIFGGSRGAASLNRAVVDALGRLKASGVPLRFIHQTGQQDYEMVQRAYAENRLEAEVQSFFDRMADCFAPADLALCRAGASTVAELTAAGQPSILVPFPHATDEHQLRNAEALQRAGAALLLEQKNATGERLAEEILGLLARPEKLRAMAGAARGLAVPDAAERIVNLLEGVAL